MQRIWARGAPAAPASHSISCLITVAETVALQTPLARGTRSISTDQPANATPNELPGAGTLKDAERKGPEYTETITPQRTMQHVRRASQTRQLHTLRRPTHRQRRLTRTEPPSRSSHFLDWATGKNTGPDGSAATGSLSEFEPKPKEHVFQHEDVDDDIDEHFDMALDGEQAPEWLVTDIVRADAIRKLALNQLAIRLVVRPAISHSYYGVLKNYGADASHANLNLPALLFKLNAIRRRLAQVKANPTANIGDLTKEINTALSQRALVAGKSGEDIEVREITSLYLSGQMSLEELLFRLSNNLINSQNVDRSYAFMVMIKTFTKARQNDIAHLVLKTLLPYQFKLTPSLIVVIIHFFRKSKDLKAFDLFLQMLQGVGYPVDMGKLGLYVSKVVNGIKISVPPVESTNQVLYASLIMACLRFDQPDRAMAYLLYAKSLGVAEDYSVLMAYLKFNIARQDWQRGQTVLKQTLTYIGSTTEHSLARLERLVVLMVRLCDACQQFEISDGLIDAAVANGFSWEAPHRQKDITFDIDPEFKRWKAAAAAQPRQADSKNLETPDVAWTKYYEFCQRAKALLLDPVPSKVWPDRERVEELVDTNSTDRLQATFEGPSPFLPASAGYSQSTTNPSITNHSEALSNEPTTEASATSPVTSRKQDNLIGALRYEVYTLKKMVNELYREKQIGGQPGKQFPVSRGHVPRRSPLPGRHKNFPRFRQTGRDDDKLHPEAANDVPKAEKKSFLDSWDNWSEEDDSRTEAADAVPEAENDEASVPTKVGVYSGKFM
ncbi:hypothetical protein BJY04DRAFT_3484 [Aspergillus karnatakaensis]|uniref:uncharacterized protein n=1 Tax=Aspergillus karnatakaensis TaxID=1810916 RepID=UPI003CCCAF37